MSTEQQPSRSGRGGGGAAAPVGSTVAIVVAVVAVVLGFLILRDLRDDDGPSAGPNTTEPTTPDSASATSTTTLVPESTTTTIVTQGAQVVVANASGAAGTAGKWTTALQTRGFSVGEPANAAGAEARLDVTKVYVVAGSEAVAQSVANVLGGLVVEPMPATVPTQSGSIGTATVLVMLGKDIAEKALADVEPGAATTTTVAGATSSSAAAG